MNDEELEFAISQLADGTLDAVKRAALERRLADDPYARKLLAEYQALDAVIRGASGKLPTVNWEQLAGSISAGISQAGAHGDGVGPGERDALVPEFEPADVPPLRLAGAEREPRRLIMPMAASWGGWAVAALVMLAVGIHQYLEVPFSPPGTVAIVRPARTNITVSPGSSPVSLPALAMVQGPSAEAAPGKSVAMVTIGPSPQMAEAGAVNRYAEEVIYRQPHVVIGSGGDSGQDAASSPYQR